MNAENQRSPVSSPRPCLSRREVLLTGAVATTVLLVSCRQSVELASAGAGDALEELEAELAHYPKTRIADLNGLQTGVPIVFRYPFDDGYSSSILVKLGVPAGGGVGPDADIVAFNMLCTHMGGVLSNQSYVKEHRIIGPCPLHQATFDLARYGMVVAGSATESLPQVVLKVEGNAIFATGVLGLIYGKRDNLDTV